MLYMRMLTVLAMVYSEWIITETDKLCGRAQQYNLFHARMDIDYDNYLNVTEFLRLIGDGKTYFNTLLGCPKIVDDYFNAFDENDNRIIDVFEFKNFMNFADVNNDGKLSKKEFRRNLIELPPRQKR